VHALTRSQAGLFSAVASAFIIQVQSEVQPDPNNETAALLRVLLYKINNTTFGNDVPTLPQWTGPPRTIVQVQAILFASFVASLFSAFLAMLGKQWLNRYASTDMRGTAIDRSQNRQRKLDGIITWYFDYVMESLPLMLQVALLLLCCALSLYLWEINVTVASVVISITSFGLIIYIFIVAAGAASESCPYQTPGSQALRYLMPKIQSIFHSASSTMVSAASTIAPSLGDALQKSKAFRYIAMIVKNYSPWWSGRNIMPFLRDMVLAISYGLIIDTYHLGRAMVRMLSTFPAGAYRLGTTAVRSLVSLACRVRNRLHGTSLTPEQRSDQQAIVLDSRCISWMVQTSLDKVVHLSSLKHLATTTALADFDPTLITFCFDAFIGCINVSDDKVVVMQGLEQLLIASIVCCLRTISHPSVMDPRSRILEDVRQRYVRVFSSRANFNDLPFSSILHIIHCIFYPIHRESIYLPIPAGSQKFPISRVQQRVQWGDYKLLGNEHITVARALTQLAWFERQGGRRGKVPRWLLRFALHSLSQYPLPSASVVVDCLSIITMDLGYNPSIAGTLGERCVCI
jgi:hypothetical protein